MNDNDAFNMAMDMVVDTIKRVTTPDSATRSADSAEPFCDCTPNHLCKGRMVHLPRGEQCDQCGEEV